VKDRASATRHGDFMLRRKTIGGHPDLWYVNPPVSLITEYPAPSYCGSCTCSSWAFVTTVLLVVEGLPTSVSHEEREKGDRRAHEEEDVVCTVDLVMDGRD
jgi:hypothetical protein